MRSGGFIIDAFTLAEPRETSLPQRPLTAEQNKIHCAEGRDFWKSQNYQKTQTQTPWRKQEAIILGTVSAELEGEGVAGVLFQVSEAAELLPRCRRVSWSGGLSLASSLRADPTTLITRLREHVLPVRNEPAYRTKMSKATRGGSWS